MRVRHARDRLDELEHTLARHEAPQERQRERALLVGETVQTRLRAEAHLDELTRLANRTRLNQYLDDGIVSNRAHARPMAALLIDELVEIGLRALSPGINDPGTAIDVIGTLVRLFTLWQSPLEKNRLQALCYNRVSVPELVTDDMFDDAFTVIARDGAGMAEVAIRLQKAFCALAETNDQAMGAAARNHSRMALTRSELAMGLQEEGGPGLLSGVGLGHSSNGSPYGSFV